MRVPGTKRCWPGRSTSLLTSLSSRSWLGPTKSLRGCARRDEFHLETPWPSLTRLIHEYLGIRFGDRLDTDVAGALGSWNESCLVSTREYQPAAAGCLRSQGRKLERSPPLL